MDQQAAIKDMINSIGSGKASEVQDKFNNIMNARIGDSVNDYKETLSKSVFNNPEMVAMGLADGDEHITEMDPAEGPITIESGDEDENV